MTRLRGTILALVALAVLVSACSNAAQGQEGLPSFAYNSRESLEGYRFAAANQELLSQLPCYCGCGALGHVNNYDCYFTGQPDDGSQAFESHALNCIICVDITQDAMRLLREGKSPAEIRDYVDTNYSRYGPSNMPG